MHTKTSTQPESSRSVEASVQDVATTPEKPDAQVAGVSHVVVTAPVALHAITETS
jgi:hypothetical protein